MLRFMRHASAGAKSPYKLIGFRGAEAPLFDGRESPVVGKGGGGRDDQVADIFEQSQNLEWVEVSHAWSA
jgi:hypothetical protein